MSLDGQSRAIAHRLTGPVPAAPLLLHRDENVSSHTLPSCSGRTSIVQFERFYDLR